MIDKNKNLNKYMMKKAILKYKTILYDEIKKKENYKKDQLSILNTFDYFSENERYFFESTFIDNKRWYDFFISRRGFFRVKKKLVRKILHILYEEF